MSVKVVSYTMTILNRDVTVEHNETYGDFRIIYAGLEITSKEWITLKATVDDLLGQAGYGDYLRLGEE